MAGRVRGWLGRAVWKEGEGIWEEVGKVSFDDVWMCGCEPHHTDAGDAGVNAAAVPVEDFATEPLRFHVQTKSCGETGGGRGRRRLGVVTSPVGKFSTNTPSAAVRARHVYSGERMRAGRRGTHAECWQGANLSNAHYHIPTACGASTHLEGVATGPRVAEQPMLL